MTTIAQRLSDSDIAKIRDKFKDIEQDELPIETESDDDA